MSKMGKQVKMRKNLKNRFLEDTVLNREPWKGRPFVLGGIILVAAVVSIYAFVLARRGGAHTNRSIFVHAVVANTNHTIVSEEQALSGKSQFGQSSPSTEAERELEKMLHGEDENIDLALANWLIVADIPQFHDLTREGYFKQLDAMTEQVRQDMAKMKTSGWKGADSNDPASRCRMFCNAMIRQHFAYAEEFRQENLTPALLKGLYTNADYTFLAGLLRTQRGSCVSMPLIYMVIGQ